MGLGRRKKSSRGGEKREWGDHEHSTWNTYIYRCPNKACSLVQWKFVSKHLIWEGDSEVEGFSTQAWGWEFESPEPEEMLVGICSLLVIPEGKGRTHHTHGLWVTLRNSASMKKAQEWLRLSYQKIFGGFPNTNNSIYVLKFLSKFYIISLGKYFASILEISKTITSKNMRYSLRPGQVCWLLLCPKCKIQTHGPHIQGSRRMLASTESPVAGQCLLTSWTVNTWRQDRDGVATVRQDARQNYIKYSRKLLGGRGHWNSNDRPMRWLSLMLSSMCRHICVCTSPRTINQSISQSLTHSINQCKSLLATQTQHPHSVALECGIWW